MAVVEVRGLKKSYGDVVALGGINLEVAPGEVVAMLGPNGAGKTTTIEILEGFRTPDAGAVTVLGSEPVAGGRSFRDRIGIVLQSSGIEGALTVEESLTMYSRYYSAPRPPDEVIELVGLGEKRGGRVATLSGGQRRRLDLALGILGAPELLFLDEPTTGFDPVARRHAWELIDQLSKTGTTILLTTHYLEEAQRLADRVVVIDRGVIVAQGDPATLGGRDTARAVIVFRLPEGVSVDGIPNAGSIEVSDRTVTLTTDQPTAALHELTRWALERGRELEGLEVKRPTLEDVYLRLVDRQPDGESVET
ncbi:MAG TPA: ABC transporter ATP-binding protein [Acidimicrobiia bacterium]|nr:ABC transporter ATP-binding protein [Acidimicrobiia bacterium]